MHGGAYRTTSVNADRFPLITMRLFLLSYFFLSLFPLTVINLVGSSNVRCIHPAGLARVVVVVAGGVLLEDASALFFFLLLSS